MKRYLLVLAFLAVAGCRHEVIVPGGTVTTDSTGKVTHIQSKDGSMDINGDKMTIKGKDGTVAETGTVVSEADLGAPFYPGSAETPGGYKVTQNGKMSASSMRTTGDSGKQVLEFYVSKLGPAKQTTESGAMTMGSWEKDGKTIAVMVTTADGKSNIQVITGPK